MREYGKGRALVVGCAMVIAGCGGKVDAKPGSTSQVPVESTTVAAQRATAGVRVLILGTSLTAGQGLDPDSAFPAVLQGIVDSSGFAVTVVAQGVSGETSAGALGRVDWLLRDRADVVILETGANDGLRGIDPASTRANLTQIISKFRAANPAVRVLLTQMEAPPNLGPNYTRDFRDAFITVAREQQVTLIPFFLAGVAGVDSMNQDDRMHPNEAGARKAAWNIWKALWPVLVEVPGARRSGSVDRRP